MDELKIAEGDVFSAIRYRSVTSIKVVEVGISVPEDGFSSMEKLKLRMLLDFLRHEFIREVGLGTEHLYKITEALIKDHCDLPEEVSDGWCYPSFAKKGGINMCFRPHIARNKLSLDGVIIASGKKTGDDRAIQTYGVAHGFDAKGNFIYHSIGSEVQKHIFPEIRHA